MRGSAFDTGKRRFLPRDRVEREEIQVVRGNLAKNANGRRCAGTLKISNAGFGKHQLGSAAGERKAHEARKRLTVPGIRIANEEDFGAIGIQAGSRDGLIAADEQVRSRLVDGLLEKMEDAVAIRRENHGLAVRGP